MNESETDVLGGLGACSPPGASTSINELAAALAKAQGAMSAAVKDTDNAFYKSRYADLASVWEACRAPLSSNGLAVVQTIGVASQPGAVRVNTVLIHSSGQWIRSEIEMQPVKSDPQGIGSTITYARRYALSAIVGVCQDDDDGNAASGVGKAAPKAIDRMRATLSEPIDKISEEFANADSEAAIRKIWGRLSSEQMSKYESVKDAAKRRLGLSYESGADKD